MPSGDFEKPWGALHFSMKRVTEVTKPRAATSSTSHIIISCRNILILSSFSYADKVFLKESRDCLPP